MTTLYLCHKPYKEAFYSQTIPDGVSIPHIGEKVEIYNPTEQIFIVQDVMYNYCMKNYGGFHTYIYLTVHRMDSDD